jgi:diguanylate cyclase (GGDEF)-like protein
MDGEGGLPEDGREARKSGDSLAARTLRIAVLRIGLVSICAGAVSYFINQSTIEDAVRRQLILSTEQTLQRESLPFREIRELEQNFLDEFRRTYADRAEKRRLARDFDGIFYRHADGSYTQRPGLFEGKSLPDGRRFAGMSATYAPDITPDDDIKSRFALSYILSHKYGSSTAGRLFNFYGVVPEKGFPIYQAADIAKAFTYSGPEALRLETYEFYSRGFGSKEHATFFTRMYWDYSNNAWMTTVATPDVADAAGKHRILACVDVLLDDLMRRVAHPAIQGARSTIFLADGEGTLIYHPDLMDEIKNSAGKASIKSLRLERDYPLLAIGQSLALGKVELVDAGNEIVAVGRLPETPGVLTIRYPKSLMRPAIFQNLAIVIALGLLTLLVEIFVIRSILQNQVAIPLARLVHATRLVGLSRKKLDSNTLPIQSRDEIGELARDFASMVERVDEAQAQLERKVGERTAALEEAIRQLTAMSTTDGLTGIANRRRFDEVLASEWRRAQRARSNLMLAMVDVDWFKKYNDHYGHLAGDDCLRNVARLLSSHIHRAGDLVARYGGEEFAIVVTMENADSALSFVQAICDDMAKAALPHDMSPFGRITISIGVACAIPGDGETVDDLMIKADDALYRAKELGRNRACLYGDGRAPVGSRMQGAPKAIT